MNLRVILEWMRLPVRHRSSNTRCASTTRPRSHGVVKKRDTRRLSVSWMLGARERMVSAVEAGREGDCLGEFVDNAFSPPHIALPATYVRLGTCQFRPKAWIVSLRRGQHGYWRQHGESIQEMLSPVRADWTASLYLATLPGPLRRHRSVPRSIIANLHSRPDRVQGCCLS